MGAQKMVEVICVGGPVICLAGLVKVKFPRWLASSSASSSDPPTSSTFISEPYHNHSVMSVISGFISVITLGSLGFYYQGRYYAWAEV